MRMINCNSFIPWLTFLEFAVNMQGSYLDIGHYSSFLLERKHHLAEYPIKFLVAGEARTHALDGL